MSIIFIVFLSFIASFLLKMANEKQQKKTSKTAIFSGAVCKAKEFHIDPYSYSISISARLTELQTYSPPLTPFSPPSQPLPWLPWEQAGRHECELWKSHRHCYDSSEMQYFICLARRMLLLTLLQNYSTAQLLLLLIPTQMQLLLLLHTLTCADIIRSYPSDCDFIFLSAIRF